MLIRLANPTLTSKQQQKPKKKRPELTLVTVTTRNDVDIEPGYHRGADHYLITNTFGTHRLYSLTVNRMGLTGQMIVDDAMKRLRQTAGWTKVVDHAPNFHPAEILDDTNRSPLIVLMLGAHRVGYVIPEDDNGYRLMLDKDFDAVSRDTLTTIIHEFLKKEIAMAADDLHPAVSNKPEVNEDIDAVKAFMRDYERNVGYKLNWDEWQDILGVAYDELAEEEE
jgi:hypothetical protein